MNHLLEHSFIVPYLIEACLVVSRALLILEFEQKKIRDGMQECATLFIVGIG